MIRPLLPIAWLALGLSIARAETRDLFIVAGQSNSVGYDALSSQLPPDAKDAETLFWFRVGDPPPDEFDSIGAKWQGLIPQPRGNPMPAGADGKKAPRQYGNFARAEGGFGPEIGFVRHLRAQGHNAPAVLKVAFSGTDVARDWDPKGEGEIGACYRALLEQYRNAIAAAQSRQIELQPRALIWVQGESDATAAFADKYQANLGAMLQALRRDLEAPDLRALLSVNTRFGNGRNSHMPTVIAAQKALAAAHPQHTSYVDTEGAETLPPSHTHFTTSGTLEIGRRHAQAWLAVAKPAAASSPQKPSAGKATATEPTNATEAAAARARANQIIAQRYAAIVAKLPADEQAWERTLEQQLGNFYLPLHQADKVAGRSNAWDFVRDDQTLPRILIIGDSVSRGYTQALRRELKGIANVHRAPANCGPTASGLKNLEVWLGKGQWDLIHFNFGIHDRNTATELYRNNLKTLITRMRPRCKTLMWASTTPCPDTPDGKSKSAPIIERNQIAAALMQEQGILIDDLHAAILPELARLQNPNDVHFSNAGYDFLGKAAAQAIQAALKH